jgi:excisionase family DNA binding protein
MARTQAPRPARLLTLSEVAEELGGVSLKTVDRYIKRGALPVTRLPGGRLRRIAREDLDRLIEDWKAESR